jgi:RNA polymerase sigma-54 factor
MLKPSLQLRIGQQLTMTPQLQQAIRLLQLPSLDLQAHVRETLETNVMLEAEDELAADALRTSCASARSCRVDEKYAELDGNTTPVEQREEPEVEIADEAWGEQTSGPSDTPGRATMTAATISATSTANPAGTAHRAAGARQALAIDLAIARVITDAITDDGYLKDDLEDIRLSLLPEIEATPRMWSACSARCSRWNLPASARATWASASLCSCASCIRTPRRAIRDPRGARAPGPGGRPAAGAAAPPAALQRRRPGNGAGAGALLSSAPRRGGQSGAGRICHSGRVRAPHRSWLDRRDQPGDRAAGPRQSSYANLISRAPDHAMLRTQLQEARWLMRSLEIRNETLIKVARCIVQRQTSFFELGEEAMEPLILKDVAEAVEMHESTISRVTTAKYMHTPRGVFEFRYFFSSHVEAADGTEMSSTAIRAKIKKLISQENPENPWSDSKLAEILSQEGIPVARRTVAKYREGMQIAPSNERKRAAARAS